MKISINDENSSDEILEKKLKKRKKLIKIEGGKTLIKISIEIDLGEEQIIRNDFKNHIIKYNKNNKIKTK